VVVLAVTYESPCGINPARPLRERARPAGADGNFHEQGSVLFNARTDRLRERVDRELSRSAAKRSGGDVREPKYAEFRSRPCRYSGDEVWVLVKGQWHRLDTNEQNMRPVPRSQARYRFLFGADLPPLPGEAFRIIAD
jgi:hypothetical protein